MLAQMDLVGYAYGHLYRTADAADTARRAAAGERRALGR